MKPYALGLCLVALPFVGCSHTSSPCQQLTLTQDASGKVSPKQDSFDCPSPGPTMMASIVPVGTPSPNPSPIATPPPPPPTKPPATVEPSAAPSASDNPEQPTPTPLETPGPIVSAPPTDSPTGPTPIPQGSPPIITGAGLGRADDVVDTIGYNSETLYRDTPYHLVPAVMQNLERLGVRHFRDSLLPHGNSSTRNATDANTWNPPNDPSYIEPCLNEYDTYHDPNWVGALTKCITSQVPTLERRFHVPILSPPMAYFESFPLLARALDAAHFDHKKYPADVHFGVCDGQPATTRYKSYTTALAAVHAWSPRVWMTEVGYSTRDPTAPPTSLGPNNYGRACAIPDDIIVAYDQQTIMHLRNLGVERVYFFEGADVPGDHVFGGMGAVRADGALKPQALAIGNMIRLYTDPAGKCQPDGDVAKVTADMPVISRTDEFCSRKKIVYVQPDVQAYTYKAQDYRGVHYGDHSRIPMKPGHASIVLPGYHATLVYTSKADGSLEQTPAPPVLDLNSIYPRYVIEEPN